MATFFFSTNGESIIEKKYIEYRSLPHVQFVTFESRIYAKILRWNAIIALDSYGGGSTNYDDGCSATNLRRFRYKRRRQYE